MLTKQEILNHLKSLNEHGNFDEIKQKLEIQDDQDLIFLLIKSVSNGPENKALEQEINQEFIKLLGKQENERFFEYKEKSSGKNLLFTLLGMQKLFANELIILAIEKTKNIDTITYSSPSSSPFQAQSALSFEKTPIDHLIAEQAYDNKVSEIAIALLEKGAKLSIQNEVISRYLLDGRSIESDLAKNLCLYFIEKGDASLFFNLIRFQEKEFKKSVTSSRQTSEARSRSESAVSFASPRASQSFSGVQSSIDAAFSLFQFVITHYCDQKNQATDPRSEESLPSFILRKCIKEPDNSFLEKLWSFIQSREVFTKLAKKGDFKIQDDQGNNFYHHLAKRGNADIFHAAKFSLKKDKSPLFTQNKAQNLPLHIACQEGFLGATLELARLEDMDIVNDDFLTPLALAITSGKTRTAEVLVNLGALDLELQSESSEKTAQRTQETDKNPLILAIKGNHETFFEEILLPHLSDPNLLFLDIDETGSDKSKTILDYAIQKEKFSFVKALIAYGADQNNNNYKRYKLKLTTSQQKELEEAEAEDKNQIVKENKEKVKIRIEIIQEIDRKISFLKDNGMKFYSPLYKKLCALKERVAREGDIDEIKNIQKSLKNTPNQKVIKILSFLNDIKDLPEKITAFKEALLQRENIEEMHRSIDMKLRTDKEMEGLLKLSMINDLDDSFKTLKIHDRFTANFKEKCQELNDISNNSKQMFELFFNLQDCLQYLPEIQKTNNKNLEESLLNFDFEKIEKYLEKKPARASLASSAKQVYQQQKQKQ